jgi:hypothetical protein
MIFCSQFVPNSYGFRGTPPTLRRKDSCSITMPTLPQLLPVLIIKSNHWSLLEALITVYSTAMITIADKAITKSSVFPIIILKLINETNFDLRCVKKVRHDLFI